MNDLEHQAILRFAYGLKASADNEIRKVLPTLEISEEEAQRRFNEAVNRAKDISPPEEGSPEEKKRAFEEEVQEVIRELKKLANRDERLTLAARDIKVAFDTESEPKKSMFITGIRRGDTFGEKELKIQTGGADLIALAGTLINQAAIDGKNPCGEVLLAETPRTSNPKKRKKMKVYVIYGVPLSTAVIKQLQEWENEGSKKFKGDWDEEELSGFTMLGKDAAEEPVGFCGKIIDTIEGDQYSRQEDLCLAPNEDEEKEANENYAKLPKELKEILEENDEQMGVYFMLVSEEN